MDEKGYIKFNPTHTMDSPVPAGKIKKLNEWRCKLYEMGLIGVYPNGIGFGNISIRCGKSGQFIITGSATGGIKKLDGRHYTKVTDFDLDRNSLSCKGPIVASSESMTHAAVYLSDRNVNAVMHVHNMKLWKKLVGNVPTTSSDAAYGTVEMAGEIMRLFSQTDAKEKKIIAMAGHEEGVISFGRDLDEAGKVLLDYYKKSV